MKTCKKPRVKKKNHDDDDQTALYQTPTDISEEEMQRSYEFVNKVKEIGGEIIFEKFIDAMKSFQSKSLTYIQLQTRVVFILRHHDVLLHGFNQLLSDLDTSADQKNHNTSTTTVVIKSDVERTIDFLDKIQALGKDLYCAFLNALSLMNDIPTLVEQLDSVLLEHASLKEEFKAFLMDSRLLKRPNQDLVEATTQEEYCLVNNITPSYSIIPEASSSSSSSSPSSSDEILNTKYVSSGHNEYDGTTKVKKRKTNTMNSLEDKLCFKDQYFHDLESVVRFGNSGELSDDTQHELSDKPPVRFIHVVQKFYAARGRKVPLQFKTDPRRAIQAILPMLQIVLEEMKEEKKLRVDKIYRRQQQRLSKQCVKYKRR